MTAPPPPPSPIVPPPHETSRCAVQEQLARWHTAQCLSTGGRCHWALTEYCHWALTEYCQWALAEYCQWALAEYCQWVLAEYRHWALTEYCHWALAEYCHWALTAYCHWALTEYCHWALAEYCHWALSLLSLSTDTTVTEYCHPGIDSTLFREFTIFEQVLLLLCSREAMIRDAEEFDAMVRDAEACLAYQHFFADSQLTSQACEDSSSMPALWLQSHPRCKRGRHK